MNHSNRHKKTPYSFLYGVLLDLLILLTLLRPASHFQSLSRLCRYKHAGIKITPAFKADAHTAAILGAPYPAAAASAKGALPPASTAPVRQFLRRY